MVKQSSKPKSHKDEINQLNSPLVYILNFLYNHGFFTVIETSHRERNDEKEKKEVSFQTKLENSSVLTIKRIKATNNISFNPKIK